MTPDRNCSKFQFNSIQFNSIQFNCQFLSNFVKFVVQLKPNAVGDGSIIELLDLEGLGITEWPVWSKFKKMKTIKNFSKFVAAAIIVLGGSTAIAGNLTKSQLDCEGENEPKIIRSEITAIEVSEGRLTIRTNKDVIDGLVLNERALRYGGFTAESLAILLQGGANIYIHREMDEDGVLCNNPDRSSVRIVVTQHL